MSIFVGAHVPSVCTQKPDVDIIVLLFIIEACSLTELDSLARLAGEHLESHYLHLGEAQTHMAIPVLTWTLQIQTQTPVTVQQAQACYLSKHLPAL